MTSNPFDLYPASDDPLYQTLDELRVKRGEVGTAWTAFEEARNQAAKVNRLEDEDVQRQLEDLQADYKKASAEVKELEERHRSLAVKRVAGGASALSPERPASRRRHGLGQRSPSWRVRRRSMRPRAARSQLPSTKPRSASSRAATCSSAP